MSVNLNIYIGNMTDDPGRRYTPNNIQITTFGLAVNKPGRRDERPKPLFIDIECWDKLAEQVYNDGRKGRKVFVQGTLERDEWEDRDSGQKRYKYYVKAFVVRWLDSRGSRDDDRDDDRGRRDDRDDRRRDSRDDRRSRRDDDRDERRPSRRDEEPRSRSNARDDRDNDAPPPDDRDSRGSGRPDDDLPF